MPDGIPRFERSTAPEDGTPRRDWMAVLAKATAGEIEAVWHDVDPKPDYVFLRQPEAGMMMVQARAGGTGARFNAGEMTVTRCAVQCPGANANETVTGFAWIAGRDRRHAEIAAVLDALLQMPDRHDPLAETVIEPLRAAQQARRTERGRKAAATKVDFFTMVRGEDPK